MGDVTVKTFEIRLHQSLDCRWGMAHVLDCMFEGVAFGIQWSKCGAAHLKPAFTLALVSGSSKCDRSENEFLVVLPLSRSLDQHE